MANVVHIDGFLRNRCVALIVSLLKDRRSELLLTLSKGVDVSGSGVVGLLSTSLGFPVSSGTDVVSSSIPVEFDWCTILVAASKDTGLKLLVLSLASVNSFSTVVLAFNGRRLVDR